MRVASAAPASPARLSALLAMRITFVADLRSALAMSRSPGITPSRASITKRQASAISMALSVWARASAAMPFSFGSSRPAVSITVKRIPRKRASPARRSRVTPGLSSTRASLRPTSRLNSVDLPTLGRPMMAIVGSFAGSSGVAVMVSRAAPHAPQRRAISSASLVRMYIVPFARIGGTKVPAGNMIWPSVSPV